MRALTGLMLVGAVAGMVYYAYGRSGGADEFPADWHFPERRELPSLVGKPMPPIKVSNWRGGKTLTPEQMKGKIIVVDLWATWCGPCIAAIPHNNALQKKYKSKGVEILGICTAQDHERMNEVARSAGIEYYCAEDTTLETQKAWKVAFYPTYCVVDRKGIVRAAGLHPQGVELVIEKLLAE